MTKPGRAFELVAAGLLAGVFFVRAVSGVGAGVAHRRAFRVEAEGALTEAARLFQRAAVGFNRFEDLKLAGEVCLEVWDAAQRPGGQPSTATRFLAEGGGDYLEAASIAPASGGPWAGIGAIYSRIEAAERSGRPLDLGSLGASPWLLVGRPGRLAVGFVRRAIEEEPKVLDHRDELCLTLLRLGLGEEAKAALRESARVQPSHAAHVNLSWNDMPGELVEAFVEGSRESLGRTPLLTLERHLLSLGQLERRLNRLDDAERDLREALRQPGDAIARSEDAFHLALVLIDKKEYAQAKPALDQAALQPVFATSVLSLRARIAEAEGQPREALEFLQDAHRREPRNIELALQVARVACEIKEWVAAVEALRWTSIVQPESPRLCEALVETLLKAGDREKAASALEEMRRRMGDTPEVVRLRRLIEDARSVRGTAP